VTVVEFGDRFTWRKAARSADQGGSCVCVAVSGDRAGVRDSKEGAEAHSLWVDSLDWAALTSRLRR
jgi:hypothetical protein